jgi:type II secretory pathway component PulC
LNLQRGDVVLAVNDQKITATRDLAMVAAGRAYYWKITLARGGQVFTSVVGGQ